MEDTNLSPEEIIARTVRAILPLDAGAMEKAAARQNVLTKPRGAFGRLEELSILLAGIRRNPLPTTARKAVITFAGDHLTVHQEGIASAPMEVTVQMLENFVRGGAGVNVCARLAGARMMVVDMGVAGPYKPRPEIVNRSQGSGAANMTRGRAMSRSQAAASVAAGIQAVEDLVRTGGLDLLALGEMGIGNTTAASAIFSVITGAPPEEVTGPGAGISPEMREKKVRVIRKALELHRPDPSDALEILSCVGGFEIGGMTGAMLGAASRGIPVVVDGFISTASALLACVLAPECNGYLISGHFSAETGHARGVDFLRKKPLLDLDMRLGEGTGAVLAMGLVEAAARILAEMSTFDEARVIMSEMRDHL